MSTEQLLVDSNVIIYALNRTSPKNQQAQDFLQKSEFALAMAQQNILETLRVLTHPKFPNPLDVKSALEATVSIAEFCTIIAPNQETYPKVLELIREHSLAADRIYDAYLAATALTNGIDKIATDNVRDFAQFRDLEVINPFSWGNK